MAKQNNRKTAAKQQGTADTKLNAAGMYVNKNVSTRQEVKPKKALPLPFALIFTLVVWVWASWWYGDVLHVAREYSFWAPDETLMRFEEGVGGSQLWVVGRMLLMAFKWPWLGGMVMAVMLGLGSWLLGYALRLPAKVRALQYLPATIYMTVISHLGFDAYFETETGRIIGIPFACFMAVLVAALVVRVASRMRMACPVKPYKDETRATSMVHAMVMVVLAAAPFAVSHLLRPEVRVTCEMQSMMEQQDWMGMQERARKDAELSYRPIAAYYAIGLIHTGDILNKLFDIRMDYDEPYLHGFAGTDNNGLNYYQQDCDYHAGLVETAIHHGMEQMTMNGPSVRTLKLLTKCALMRGEWEVAKKYLTILGKVPFESDFIEKYSPMLYQPEMVNKDPEMAWIRTTEPIHDAMENNFIQPVFLGYNAGLVEGRSETALYYSLAVNIYTKTMDNFLMRCQPLVNAKHPLPTNCAEALAVMSGKHPEILNTFQGLEFYRDRFANFVNATRQYLSDRPTYARELFPQWKGQYGYYYFFGNLKATKKKDEKKETSNQGVN